METSANPSQCTNLVGGLGREREEKRKEKKEKKKKKRKSQGMRLEGYLLRRPFKNIGRRKLVQKYREAKIIAFAFCHFPPFPKIKKRAKNGRKVNLIFKLTNLFGSNYSNISSLCRKKTINYTNI